MLGHAAWGVGVVLGAGWSALNLVLWSRLAAAVVSLPPRSFLNIVVASSLKFPVLYGGGYLLLDALTHRGRVEVTGVLVGVSLPLVVLVLNAVRQLPRQHMDAAPSCVRPPSSR